MITPGARSLRLRDRLAERYPQLSFERRSTSLTPEAQEVHYGPELWTRDPDTCCTIRKVEPMREALGDVDVWVTGLMRSQSDSRGGLRVVEWDWQYQLLKVNPLASWDRARVWEYVQQHEVPYNELHDRGYPSLGCTHCTLPVAGNTTGEYTREGRWQGRSKLECGLHQIVGRQMTA
jgi:phosphoadenosine phosphosulfate reductase